MTFVSPQLKIPKAAHRRHHLPSIFPTLSLTFLTLHQNPNTLQPHSSLCSRSYWIPSSINNTASSLAEFEAYHANTVILEDTDTETDNDKHVYEMKPSWLRLSSTTNQENGNITNLLLLPPVVQMAEEASQSTFRWCDSIVAELGLCPWARSSLDAKNAVRIKIIPFDDERDYDYLERFERAVRRSAVELLQITNVVSSSSVENERCEQQYPSVDPNLAITFVVALPNDGRILPSFLEFESFHQFFLDFEDELLDEAADCPEDGLGNFVTIAPFHPHWRFSSEDEKNENVLQPIDFEKRAPYPTISIVLTEAIVKGGGKEATERIGLHNEEVLMELGTEKLLKLFQKKL